LNRGRGMERASSQSGGGTSSTNGKSDSLGVWLPVRVLSRLVHSLSFHHPHSSGHSRNEKHGVRRRSGRVTGSTKEVNSMTAAASLHN
uniref:Pecanex-like protein n=1 Tax=Echinostoma caproni TaxID=27848 RepID=A0A182ZZQ7_9TREM